MCNILTHVYLLSLDWYTRDYFVNAPRPSQWEMMLHWLGADKKMIPVYIPIKFCWAQVPNDFIGMGVPMLKIRRSQHRLIFNMGIPILVRWHLYTETPPRIPVHWSCYKYNVLQFLVDSYESFTFLYFHYTIFLYFQVILTVSFLVLIWTHEYFCMAIFLYLTLICFQSFFKIFTMTTINITTPQHAFKSHTISATILKDIICHWKLEQMNLQKAHTTGQLLGICHCYCCIYQWTNRCQR